MTAPTARERRALDRAAAITIAVGVAAVSAGSWALGGWPLLLLVGGALAVLLGVLLGIG